MISRQYPRRNQFEDSIVSTQRHHIDTRPFNKHSRVQKPKSFIQSGSHINQLNINVKNEISNAFKINQAINKLEVNPSFLQLLNNQYSMSKVVIVSVWGSPRSGKSFLIDNLISAHDGITLRVFSKFQNQGANCSLRRIQTNEGNPIIFLDWQGVIEADQQMQTNMFLLMYLISSAIVFNYNSNDIRYETMFVEFCERIKTKLVSDETQYSLPQLISIRRDVTHSNNRATNFIESLHKLELFQPNTNLLYFPYPGTQGISKSQIVDAPNLVLEKNFTKTCVSMLDILKILKPMYINDNPITSNMLSILIGAYVNMINRSQRVVVDTCWNNVLEALAVNGYNNFVTVYTQFLQKEFRDEKPLTKYELFKKLFKVKNQTNRKLLNFTNIRGDPIFDRYKQKVKDFVNGKQLMIKTINTSKSNLANSRYVSDSRRINLSANEKMKEQRMFKYVNSLRDLPQDYNKPELLLNTVKDLMHNQLKKVGNKAQEPHLKAKFQELNDKNNQIQQRIFQKNEAINNLEKQLKQSTAVNQRYVIKIQQKQLDLRKTINQNNRRQQQRKDKMTAMQRQADMKLSKLKQQQNDQIIKQSKIIVTLKSNINDIDSKIKMEQAEQAEIRSRIEKKNQQIKDWERKIKEKQKLTKDQNNEIERLKELLNRPEKKKTTCGCFG